MSLTFEQQCVVDAPLAGPLLVDAGAGTGKTFTLVERAAALVEKRELEPQQLLVVTFTNAAAAEIADRLERRFADCAQTGRPACGTFHGIAASLLREFAYDTGSSPDVRAIDDARARGVFTAAFRDLLAGKLGVDTSALPLLERERVFERNLAGIALQLKNTNVPIDRWEREALEAAGVLERLNYGAIVELKPNGQPYAGWPRPNPPLTDVERAEQAERERRNVIAVAALFRRFDELLAKEHLLTFGDVLTRATAMLQRFPAVAKTLRARWLHAMVDEFQDTNGVQVTFLKALFGDDLRPVLVVGDVRQAIYAFNGADPNGIVAFRMMDGCKRYPLTVNRRSYKQVLDAAHHALARANAVPPELHNELTAHRNASQTIAVRAQLFSGEGALEREADSVARTARKLVDEGVSPKKIAVLMRSRTKAPLFAAALRRYGLAVQLHGGAGFFGAPEIREVVAWLKLVGTPDDMPSLVVALQSAAIALGDGVVAALAAQRELAHAALTGPLDGFSADERVRLERFRAISRIASVLADVPLADAARTVVFESGAEIARLGGEPGELDQARANLDKFLRLAADFATDRPTARIEDFLIELEEREALDDDEAEAELEGERIALMTIHAAKGLEWDHVFVANVSPQSFPLSRGGGRDLVAKLDERRRALAFAHSVDGRTPLRWHITSNEIDDTNGRVLARAKDDSEEHRLFYVAMTRARDVLYVTGSLGTRALKPSVCLAAVAAWLEERVGDLGAATLVSDDLASPYQAALPLATVEHAEFSEIRRRLDAQLERESAPAAVALRPGPLSYTAIALHAACPRRARYHYVLGLPDLGDEAAPSSDNGDHREPARRDPARFGRVVHLVLEAIALARIAGDEPAVDRFLDDAMGAEDCGSDAALRADARRAIDQAIPVLAAFTPEAAELRFDIEVDGVELRGYIDLLARDAQGRLAIIDYKTGYTESGHYAMQFALYRRAVVRQYPEHAETLLLRISPDHAALEAVEPATSAALSEAVATARVMDSDRPEPGPQCRNCPYAYAVCDAAPALIPAG